MPEALLYLARNNREEVERHARKVEDALRQALAGLRRGGSSRRTIAVLYWHSPDFSVRDIADAFGLDSRRAKTLAEENPIVTFRCLDCDAPLRPQTRELFREMLSTLRTLDRNPQLLREYLYTGLHCDDCMEEREERWDDEWRR